LNLQNGRQKIVKSHSMGFHNRLWVLVLGVSQNTRMQMEPHSKVGDPATASVQNEQRQKNPTLRGLVDGLLDHIRDLSSRVDDLSPEELEYEHQRFDMIAELMWAAITDEKSRSSVGPDQT
jgi:hypothetical protein